MNDEQRDRRFDRTQTLASAVGEIARNVIVAVAAARDVREKPSAASGRRAGFRA